MKLNQTPIVIYVLWKREKPVLMFYVEMEEGCIFSLLCSYILFTKKNSISLRTIQKYERPRILQLYDLYSI